MNWERFAVQQEIGGGWLLEARRLIPIRRNHSRQVETIIWIWAITKVRNFINRGSRTSASTVCLIWKCVLWVKFDCDFWLWTVGWSNFGCYEPLLWDQIRMWWVWGGGWGVRNGGRSFGGRKNEKKWELKSFWAGSGSYWNVFGSSIISTFLTPFVRQEKEKALRIKDTWNTSGVHVHCKCLLMCLCSFEFLSRNFCEGYYVTAVHDLERSKTKARYRINSVFKMKT